MRKFLLLMLLPFLVPLMANAADTPSFRFNITGEGDVEIVDSSDDTKTYDKNSAIPTTVSVAVKLIPADGWTIGSTTVHWNGYELPYTPVDGKIDFGVNLRDVDLDIEFVKLPSAGAEYTAPSGSGDKSGSNSYVETASTTGATGDINIARTQKNADWWELCDDQTIVTEPGQTFTLRMQAKVTSTNTSVAPNPQDLRYCVAYFFADWDGDGTFEAVAPSIERFTELGRVGYHASEESAGFGGNVKANFDYVLDISQDFTVPADAKPGNTRIRVIYTEAWDANITGNSVDGNYQSINKGYAYDYLVEIKEASTPDPVALEGDILTAEAATAAKAETSTMSNNEFVAKGTSGKAEYKGYTMDGTADNPLMIFNPYAYNTHFTTYTSAGKVLKVSVQWAKETDVDAGLIVYGLDAPVTNVFADFSTDRKIGELKKVEGEDIAVLEFPAGSEYTHYGFRPSTSNIYLKAVATVWEGDEPEPPVAEKYAVTIAAAENGTLTVKNGNEAVASGTELEAGTELTITATPADNYEVTAIKVNGTALENVTVAAGAATATFTMGNEAVEISAEFAATVSGLLTISIPATENGQLLVLNGDDEVVNGAEVAAGTELSVFATPDAGYEFKSLNVNGEAIEDVVVADGMAMAEIVVSGDITITAEFALPATPDPNNYAIRVPQLSSTTAYRIEVDEKALLDRETANWIGTESEKWPLFEESFTMTGWYKIIGYTQMSNGNNGNVLMGHQPRCHVNYNGAFTVALDTNGKLVMGGKIKTENGESAHRENFSSNVVIPTDQWVNIAAVYDAEAMNIKVYVDGKLAGTRELGAKLPAFPDNPGVITFGSTNANCWVDEAALFDGALTASQIKAAMNDAKSLDPLCFYTFNETNGTDGEYANEGSLDYAAKLIQARGSSSWGDGGIISATTFASVAAETANGRGNDVVPPVTYDVTLTTEGEGTLVAAEGVSETGAPVGETFANGSSIDENSEVYVIATPAEGYKIQSLVVDGSEVVVDGSVAVGGVSQFTHIVAVKFTAVKDLQASVKFVEDVKNSIDSILNDASGNTEIYNLQGVRVTRENLVPGIYIIRSSEGTRKVSVK